MKQRFAMLLAASLALQAAPALGQGYEAAILAQLRQEGYAQITVTTTFLGRIRITAEGAKGQREIVLNPRTGEVLRDVWFVADANSGRSGSGNSGGSSNGAGSGKSGDDGTDESSDDDSGDDDIGGSGSGGSGGGSSGGSSGGSGGGGGGDDSSSDDDDDSGSDQDDDDD